MSKTIIIGCDGTWQRGNQPNPTNIRFLTHLADEFNDASGVKQLVRHFDGVGTKVKDDDKFWKKLWHQGQDVLNGAFGTVIREKIREAYLNLAEAYEPGDRIVLIGFSRGSYTTRSLNGMIYNVGLPDWDKIGIPKLEDFDVDESAPDAKKQTAKAEKKIKKAKRKYVEKAFKQYCNKHKPNSAKGRQFRRDYALEIETTPQVQDYRGVDTPHTVVVDFDCVGSLGLPDRFWISGLWNGRHEFHDTLINRNTDVFIAARALDETRDIFKDTPIELQSDNTNTTVKTAWFAGAHGCVGGGDENILTRGLSDRAALWVMEQIEAQSQVRFDRTKPLPVKKEELQGFSPNSLAVSDNKFISGKGLINRAAGPHVRAPILTNVHYTALHRHHVYDSYRPKSLRYYDANGKLKEAKETAMAAGLFPRDRAFV